MSRLDEIKVRLSAARLHSSPAFMSPTDDVAYLLATNDRVEDLTDEIAKGADHSLLNKVIAQHLRTALAGER